MTMTEHIPYPSNYFDPYEDDRKAQCIKCGEWFDHSDMASVDEVPDLLGYILQGVCKKCTELGTECTHERNDDE